MSTTADSGGGADVFAASWAAAPSLPPDAPQEIRKLVVNVEDPQRVYSLRRASRRHNFQLLVERYAEMPILSTGPSHINLTLDIPYSSGTAAIQLIATLQLVLRVAGVWLDRRLCEDTMRQVRGPWPASWPHKKIPIEAFVRTARRRH